MIVSVMMQGTHCFVHWGVFLMQSTRDKDIACRYGGEEFLLVMPGIDLENARLRAEKLRQGVKGLSVSHLGTAPQMHDFSRGRDLSRKRYDKRIITEDRRQCALSCEGRRARQGCLGIGIKYALTVSKASHRNIV
jgi:GGDEF domain-containing protein